MIHGAPSSHLRLGSFLGATLLLAFFPACRCPAEDTPATNSTAPAPPTTADTAQDLISKSTQHLADGNLDQAASEATTAIQLDPQNPSAYELRGSIYIEKKVWDRAERDYAKADQISPDPAYKYKLAEIKFLQRAYGDARSRFALLQKDPRLGDLATYKVLLCDLLDRHDSIAAQDLAAMDQGAKQPSYYFGHFAWALFHHGGGDAAKSLAAAKKLYDKSTYDLYYSFLVEAQRFQPDLASFTTRDGKRFEKTAVFLESNGLRVGTQRGWITLPLEQLPDDLSGFPENLRDSIMRRRAILPSVEAPVSLISFTAKSGKTYDHARWALQETGLSLLSSDGWVSVPFEQLPADLSSFPPNLQQAILEKRKAAASASSVKDVVSFTTTRGKTYDHVRTSLTGSGLRVLSADGWSEVPFEQLPADLSSFPPNLQQAILEKRKAAASAPSVEDLVSFMTTRGKQYDQVRASLSDAGLRVLSNDGWVEIPFEQLPADLTPFPVEWRAKIRAAHQSGPETSSGMRLVSFTTKKGKHYDQVRAAMEKTGLRLLTSDGLIAVPFDQLPDDVSVFPEEWREQIASKQKRISEPAGQSNR